MWNTKLNDDETWLSADVVSLFTNVPSAEAIELCAEKVFESCDSVDVGGTTVVRQKFVELMTLATQNVRFVAPDGKTYCQIDGVAMGSQLGPALANVFMAARFDEEAKKRTRVYERYVDDTLMVAKKSEVNNIMSALNKLHPNIKITHELPTNGKLAFLDIMIEGNTTEVYRKPSATGVVVNFNALSPWRYKVAALKAHVKRAIEVCANSAEKLRAEMVSIRQIFTNNQWPLNAIDSVAAKITGQKLRAEQANAERDDPFMLILPYIGAQSDTLARNIYRLAKNVRVIFTTTKLRLICNAKAPIPMDVKSDLVYCLTCSSCSRRYVGQTGQHLVERISQHRTSQNSALNHHGCDSPDCVYEVIYQHRQHQIAEAIFIRELSPSLNRKEEKRFGLRLF